MKLLQYRSAYIVVLEFNQTLKAQTASFKLFLSRLIVMFTCLLGEEKEAG
jgi:hypothetical protein